MELNNISSIIDITMVSQVLLVWVRIIWNVPQNTYTAKIYIQTDSQNTD